MKERKRKKDKSEEYLECNTCKIDCSNVNGYVYGTCPIHGFVDSSVPQLNKHYCSEHKQYHCSKHQKYCMKIYGNSVMDWKAYTKEAIDEWKKKKEEEDAEVCRLQAWSDQIEYGIIKCAECGKTVCQCEDLGDELVVPSILAKQQTIIDEEGDRKTKRIKDYTKYYESLEREEKEEEEYWDNVLQEIKMVNKIKLDHLQRTGYTIEKTEIREKIKKGEIKIKF